MSLEGLKTFGAAAVGGALAFGGAGWLLGEPDPEAIFGLAMVGLLVGFVLGAVVRALRRHGD